MELVVILDKLKLRNVWQKAGLPKFIYLVVADDRTTLIFALSSGDAHDAPEERQLLLALGPVALPAYLLMDCAYEGDQTTGRMHWILVISRSSRPKLTD